MRIDLGSPAARNPSIICFSQRWPVHVPAANLSIGPPERIRFAPIAAAHNIHVTFVKVKPLHERVQLSSCTGVPTVNELYA
jgi:hypothetical protein